MDPSPIYSALPDGYMRILLVQGTKPIERGFGHDLAIECITETVCIDDVSGENDPSGFQALSYVWGSRSTMRPVHCNGNLQWITTNLYNALWHLLLGTQKLPLRLWVDAICIDQENYVEKNHQVRLMGKIYQSAQSVLVWLGLGSEQAGSDLDDFWKCLARIASKSSDETQRSIANLSDTQAERAGRKWLSQCDWFTRAWTLQEIVLARKARVIRGFDSVDWETLVAYVRNQNTYETSRTYEADVIAAASDGVARWVLSIESVREMCGFHPIGSSTSMLEDCPEGRRISHCPLRILMAYSQGRSSNNAHDKVYSLLGLYKGSWRFNVDYTQPIELTYAQCLVTMIEEEGSFPSEVLSSLHRKSCTEYSSRTLAQPLWVPDWGSLTLVNRYNLLKIEPDTTWLSNPWGTRFLQFEIGHQMSLHDHRLYASGVVLSYGASISIDGDGSNSEEFTLRQIHRILPSPPCIVNRAANELSSSNDPQAEYLLDTQAYQPVSQSAQSIYDQLWLHELEGCSCVRPDHNRLPTSTHLESRGRQKLIEQYKASGGRTEKCMTWRCLVYGFEGIMTMQLAPDPTTGELNCSPDPGFDDSERRCGGYVNNLVQLEPILQSLDRGTIFDGKNWRNMRDLTHSDRERLNVSNWRSPEDIPIAVYNAFREREPSKVCWLPVEFSIPIK